MPTRRPARAAGWRSALELEPIVRGGGARHPVAPLSRGRRGVGRHRPRRQQYAPDCAGRAPTVASSPCAFPQSAIEFWFDFSSPYSYIASEWIEALAARHGRTVRWNAILLGVTFQAAELSSPVAHPIKREYTLHDFERSARFAGVPLQPARPVPDSDPERGPGLLVARRPAAGVGGGLGAALPARLFHAATSTSPTASELKALAAEFGIDGDVAGRRLDLAEAKARLRRVCDDAVAHGVFGAPFFVVDGEPFWGNDRRGQIERWLKGGSFQVTAHGDL